MPNLDAFGLIAPNGGGNGGGGALAEVVDSTTTSASLAVDGGTVYRFTQPLTDLTISAMPSGTQEAAVIFSGGAVSAPGSAAISFVSKYAGEYESEEAEEPPIISGSRTITLTQTGSGAFVFAPENYLWCDDPGRGGAIDPASARIVLSGGSFSCVSSGGSVVFSADHIVEYTSKLMEDEDTMQQVWQVSSRIISGTVAESSDGGNTWNFGGVTITGAFSHDGMNTGGIIYFYSGSACAASFAAGGSAAMTLSLPGGTEVVSSGNTAISSGGEYILAFRGAIVRLDRITPHSGALLPDSSGSYATSAGVSAIVSAAIGGIESSLSEI